MSNENGNGASNGNGKRYPAWFVAIMSTVIAVLFGAVVVLLDRRLTKLEDAVKESAADSAKEKVELRVVISDLRGELRLMQDQLRREREDRLQRGRDR